MPTREIKFRAWETISGQFLNKKELSENLWFLTQNPQVENIILEQFTGLKDKNGKEIYEGDILGLSKKGDKIKNLRATVTWDTPTPFAGYQLNDNQRDGEYCLTKFNADHWVVLGNIHENPELLK